MFHIQPSFIQSLTVGLAHRWEPDRLFVIITTYIDESGTHGSAPLTIMAAYVGHSGAWRKFERKWGKHLDDYDLEYLHTNQIIKNKGQFKGWVDESDRKVAFVEKAFKLCNAYAIFGFVVRFRNDDFQQHYRAPGRTLGINLDSRYGYCFRVLLGHLPALVRHSFPDKKIDLHLVLEHGNANAGAAPVILKEFRRQRPNDASIIKTLTFATRVECLPIQAADFLAYTAYKYEQQHINDDSHVITVKRETEDYARALDFMKMEKRFSTFRVQSTKEDFESARAKLIEERQRRIIYGTPKPKPSFAEKHEGGA